MRKHTTSFGNIAKNANIMGSTFRYSPIPASLCLFPPDPRLHGFRNAFRTASGLHTVVVFGFCLKLFVFIYKLLYSGQECAVFADLAVVVLLQTGKSGFQFKIAAVYRAQNLDDFLKQRNCLG